MKPYWGIAIDLGVVHEDFRFLAEAYAGVPLEAVGPDIAFQWGVRWVASDYVNFDLTFGGQPDLLAAERGHHERWEVWGQLGVRLLFDAFTPGGVPGDPLGGKGMFDLVRPRAGFASTR